MVASAPKRYISKMNYLDQCRSLRKGGSRDVWSIFTSINYFVKLKNGK